MRRSLSQPPCNHRRAEPFWNVTASPSHHLRNRRANPWVIPNVMLSVLAGSCLNQEFRHFQFVDQVLAGKNQALQQLGWLVEEWEVANVGPGDQQPGCPTFIDKAVT